MSGGGFGKVGAYPAGDDFARNVLKEDPTKIKDIFAERRAKNPDIVNGVAKLAVNGDSKHLRPIKVVSIGAGATGIYVAIRKQGLARGKKPMENVDLTIYEKNTMPGGTWYENSYKGVECDVPSHLYTFTFEMNPYWTKAYAGGAEIFKYFMSVYEKYNVEPFVRFSTKITEARWDQAAGMWKLKWVKVEGDRETDERGTDECHVLINGSGALNTINYPDIEGLKSFKGKMMHSARWDKDYDFSGKTVAVIGTGASSIQIVPSIQPLCKHITVFQRTPVWVTIKGLGEKKYTGEYTEEEKQKFAADPEYHKQYMLDMWSAYESRFFQFRRGSKEQLEVVKIFQERYERDVKDPELRKKVMPNYGIGCRRITPSDTYLQAIQAPNAELCTDKVVRIHPNGVETADGKIREVDTLILATGFDTTFKPVFPVIGVDGRTLQDEWATIPESYFSVGAPGFPNYFIVIGPNSPLGQNSLLPWLEGTVDWIAEIIIKMQQEGIKSVDPDREITKKWNDYAQNFLKDYVWSESCAAWYKAKDGSGRVTAIWPGNANSFLDFLSEVRWQDFHVEFWPDA